jgi:DNA-binding MarR family transcriptional regulator
MLKAIVNEDQRALDKVNLLLSGFKEVDETMPIQVAVTFLMVAMYAPCSLTDIWKSTGWSQSTLSRHLLDLGERDRHKRPGLKLVDVKRDPMELRKNIYTLTPKGEKLAHKLASIVRA